MTTTATGTPALSFVVLFVADLDASTQYFRDQLGLLYIADQSGEGFRLFAGGEGGIQFGLIPAGEHGPKAGTVQLYFYTTDIEDLRETLRGRGVDAGPIQHPPFGDIFDVPSPHGEPPLTMMQPPR
jgi:catechol 2,3-dioxygenase-like lactoylglutathione lyase family enzyme